MIDADTEIDVTTVAKYEAEVLVETDIEDVVLEVVLREDAVTRTEDGTSTEDEDEVSMEDEEDVVETTVLDELEDGAGAGITTVTGGEFTSMMEYPVVVTVAGEGVSVTTAV